MEKKQERIPGFCALCKSKCGCISVVEEGRLVAVEPDPAHPTGGNICLKARAAPELVYSGERLLYPMRRTRPKGEADPGWQRISWDEALGITAERMGRIAADHGAESVAFGLATPSGTAITEHIFWIERLARAFGSPNSITSTEICNWHKDMASVYSHGGPLGAPDFENAGCIVLWGHNPSTSWLVHAAAVARARARGAKLVVIDPRRSGLARKAGQWLRVRPGTDGALALGIAGVMIREGWFDREFIRKWSSGCFLVRGDNGRFLRASDLDSGGDAASYVAWDEAAASPLVCDPASPGYFEATASAALDGSYRVTAMEGEVECQPAFGLYAALCAQYPPPEVERITGVPAEQLKETARLLWHCRPAAYYAWSGVAQHSNATQTDRAICLLYALTGSHDQPGGNLVLQRVPANDVSGMGLISREQRGKALGLEERPLGPPKGLRITARDFYRAVLDQEPYAVKGLVAFGINFLYSQPDAGVGAEALKALEFHVHADLFMTPSALMADIVLPVTTPWEHEALRIGSDVVRGQSLVQLRRAVVAPRGEARSDSRIVFQLAGRLGLAGKFFGGSLDDGYRHMLEPSGVKLEELRANPAGIEVPLQRGFRKYAGNGEGAAPGFATPTRRVEIYSQTFLEHGLPPLPVFVPPAPSNKTRGGKAALFPLVLTSFKSPLFCQSQHRGIASLRRLQPEPVIEIHPETAAGRGIGEQDWVRIETPNGAAKARAKLNRRLDPEVVCAQHGWWAGCEELGLAPYHESSSSSGNISANFSELIGGEDYDPISGAAPLRSYICQVSALE